MTPCCQQTARAQAERDAWIAVVENEKHSAAERAKKKWASDYDLGFHAGARLVARDIVAAIRAAAQREQT